MQRSLALVLCGLLSMPVLAAEDASGEALFLQYCAACHLNPVSDEVPDMAAIAGLGANGVLAAMNTGVMRLQAQPLGLQQRERVAEYVAGAPLRSARLPAQGLCTGPLSLRLDSDAPRWLGWGGDERNTRYRPGETWLHPGNVQRLELAWAYGLDNATQSRSQPAVVDGVLFMGGQTGQIQALDARTGCAFWFYQAAAGVRTAISVGEVDGERGPRAAIFFTDATATAYALDALNGELLWTTRVDEHHAAAATGSPTFHDGVLYVPVSGVSEETTGANPDYECCTFRGSVSALDAASGDVLWKTYLVDPPAPRGESDTGKTLWGPAGVAVWAAPTIDAARRRLYIATGNAYADPDPGTSDAIIALDMDTGDMAWVRQKHPDVWIMGCDPQSPGAGPGSADNPNCPEDLGPDYDFSASPVLTTLPDGRELIVVPQKSGLAYALDPEADGERVWDYRWGAGSPAGAVWGGTVDESRAFFAVADMLSPEPGGMRAVNLETGEELWSVPPQTPFCEPGPGCNAAQSAALTAVPGLVFSAANDGGLRAYDAGTGDILWEYSTRRSFNTVNGVEAKGGSIDGPGVVIVDGMLYVTSGNAGYFGTAGNVLLAFLLAED